MASFQRGDRVRVCRPSGGGYPQLLGLLGQDDPKKYFMVHCPAKGPPKVMHSTLADVDKEISRLAKENPGKQVYLLEAVACYVAEIPTEPKVNCTTL